MQRQEKNEKMPKIEEEEKMQQEEGMEEVYEDLRTMPRLSRKSSA